MANKTISITSLPAATGFGPGDSLVGVNNGSAVLFPYNTISGGSGSGATGATGEQGIPGVTGTTGAAGATGATGGVEKTDRLISSNNLEVILDNNGTLNTPLLLPLGFIAVCDENHMINPVVFEDNNWWQFEVQFDANPDGSIQTMINNIFPILANPGYVSGYSFRFTEADHGIPGFTFELQLNDVVLPGGAGWTANLLVTPPPTYPSTIKSLGAVKITSNSNSLILGTDGNLILPPGGDILDPNGDSVLGIKGVTITEDGSDTILEKRLETSETDGIVTITNAVGSKLTFTNNTLGIEAYTDPDGPNNTSLGRVLVGGGAVEIISSEESLGGQAISGMLVGPGGVEISTNDGVTTKSITIGGGEIILPEGGDIKDHLGNSVLGGPILPYVELTNDPFIYNPFEGSPSVLVEFTKTDYSNEVDEIDTNLAITRGNNQGIYNPYLEPGYDDNNNSGPSPKGTLWNNEGWGDLTNLSQRTYYSFFNALGEYFGNIILSAEPVMKDVANNKYYKFDFTVWGNQNNGAPVTYTRTEIDGITGEEIGSPVTFTKDAYASPFVQNDPIDTGVTIARGSNQGIFNLALETSWTTNGYISPEGTEWNSDGWGTLRNITQRNYNTFHESLGGNIDENVVGKELVMHDTINDKYYAVKFSSWTQNNQGGGFSYTRQFINTDNVFVKPDYTTEVIDIFVPDDGSGSGIGITRDENNGIYNPYREGSWDEEVSPGGTLWNIDGWDDLSDLLTRDYTTFYASFGFGGLGNKVPGTECVMYIPETEEYYAIKFTNWTQGGGGGFTYYRYKIDTTKLNAGIKFADGTTLKSASDFDKIKSRASGDRRIEEVYGNKTVSVTEVTTNDLTAVTSRSGTSVNSIWTNASESMIYNIIQNPSNYGINNSFEDIQFSLDNNTWYKWNGSTSFNGDERGYGLQNEPSLNYNQGDTIYFRFYSGGTPQVWWNKNDLPGGASNFRGAIIDYHAYTGEATFIGTIHIVDDSGDENITHTEVSSGSTDSENDDLWFVQNEGTISYRRMDGEAKNLKIHWGAKVFYGSEFYD